MIDDPSGAWTGPPEITDPRTAFDVAGRVVVITGGARGLGHAMSVGLARVGASVVLCGRTASDVERTVAEINRAGGRATGLTLDIAAPDAPGHLVETAVASYGGVDVVINNAVYSRSAPVSEVTSDEFDHAHATNVRAPVLLANVALPYLQQSEHAVVLNVLSVYTVMGGMGTGLYRATKAALEGLTKVMSKEWAEFGVRVVGISPGPFETSGGRTLEHAERVRTATALGRIARYDEIVPPVLFLISDAARFVTGTSMLFDGGMSP